MNHYTIQNAQTPPALDGAWEGPAWADVPAIDIANFHDRSSDHHPVTHAKVLHHETGIHVIFRVQDRHVRSVVTTPNGSVCGDSCAEFFVEPVAGRGYFNFEINCGGTPLVHYNAVSAAFRYDPVLIEGPRLEKVIIFHSMSKTVDSEITDPVTWFVQFTAPFELFEAFVGPVPRDSGAVWRGNFYKCADFTSQPHWAMWNRIPGALGFHRPEFFAPLIFA